MVDVYPVKASGFLRESLPEERSVLFENGIIPVNDIFFPHFSDRSKVRLFYGGYGSGKSIFIAQDLIVKCLNDEYFKCYYGRKGYVDIRGSCFETIVETIEDLKLEQYFHYSKADNSSMVIRCLLNGNKFVPFGSDDPKKLKSIKDPTHIWCEEFDQYEDGDEEKKGDFQLLFPRLRTTKAQTEFIASFNTESVYPTHWILKYFFPDLYEGEDKPQEWFVELIEGLNILRCFANYTDNYFIDKEEYYKQLQLASGGDQDTLDAIARGAWGIMNNKKPWLYNFDRNKHVRPVSFLPAYPVYVSFDFNVDPFACTLWQMSPTKGGASSFVHCIDQIVGKVRLEDMCSTIKSRYPKSILYVTGDRSGQSEQLGRNQTLYASIATNLGLRKSALILNNSNLEHSDSRELLNVLFWHYNIAIDPKCVDLISDCKKAKVDEKSSKPSQLLKDRGRYKMDTFDAMRYFFQTFFLEYVQKTYWKGMRK